MKRESLVKKANIFAEGVIKSTFYAIFLGGIFFGVSSLKNCSYFADYTTHKTDSINFSDSTKLYDSTNYFDFSETKKDSFENLFE